MIEMSYDQQTAGVKISFILRDGTQSVSCGTDGFEDMRYGEAGARCPQTAGNLRRLSFMLAAMAMLQEQEEHTSRCECGCAIYKFGGRWVHRGDKAHAREFNHEAVPRKKVFNEV
jgi:hypothetical protein